MKTKIVVDSASSLYALKGVDFACVPLKIITDDAEYLDDGTLDAVGMARTLRTYKEMCIRDRRCRSRSWCGDP